MTDYPIKVYQPKGQRYYDQMFGSALGDILTAVQAPLPKTKGVPQPQPTLNINDLLHAAEQKNILMADTTAAAQGNLDALNRIAGKKVTDMSPEFQQMYKQVTSAEAKAQIEAAQNPGVWERVMDVLSRFTYGVANSYLKESEENKNDYWKFVPFLSMVNGGAMSFEHLSDFWDGFSGKAKVTFADVLEREHPEMNSVLKFVTGLGLDVAMDPTTYIGVGAVKGGMKGVARVGSAATGREFGKGAITAFDLATQDSAKLGSTLLKESGEATNLGQKYQEFVDITRDSSGKSRFADDVQSKINALFQQGLPTTGSETFWRVTAGNLKNVDFNDVNSVAKFFDDAAKYATEGTDIARAQSTIVNTYKQGLGAILEEMQKQLVNVTKSELLVQAYKNGDLADIQSMKYKKQLLFLKDPGNSEMLTKYNNLMSERSELNRSLSALTRNPKAKARVDTVRARLKAIDVEMQKITDATEIDLRDPFTRSTLDKALSVNDPEYVRIMNELDAIDKKLNKLGMMERPGYVKRTPTKGGKVKEQPVSATSPQSIAHANDLMYSTAKKENYKEIKDLLTRKQELIGEMNGKIGKALLLHLDDSLLSPAVRGHAYRSKSTSSLIKTLHNTYKAEGDKIVSGPVGVVLKGKKRLASESHLANNRVKAIEQELAYRLHDYLLPKYQAWKRDVAAKKTEEVVWEPVQSRLVKEWLNSALTAYSTSVKGKVNPALVHDIETLLDNHPLMQRPVTSRGKQIPHKVEIKDSYTPEEIANAIKGNDRLIAEFDAKAVEEVNKYGAEMGDLIAELLARTTPPSRRGAVALRVGFFGFHSKEILAVGAPKWLQATGEKIAKINYVNDALTTLNKAFVSSAGLNPELKGLLAKERGTANEIIALQAQHLKDLFRGSNRTELNKIAKYITNPANTGNAALTLKAQEELVNISKMFMEGAVESLDRVLEISSDIRQWLPKEIRLKHADKIKEMGPSDGSLEWILKAIEDSTLEKVGIDRIIWSLQVATNKAIARQSTIENIAKLFGIQRHDNILIKAGAKVDDPITKYLIEKGYRPYSALGNSNKYGDVLFSPEIHQQLEKIDHLMKGTDREVYEFMDKYTRMWKRFVTVWNPGYHFRNTFGDVFVSWLAGVKGTRGLQSHGMAMKVLSEFKKMDIQSPMAKAIQQPDAYNAYRRFRGPSNGSKADVTLFTLKDGTKLSYGEVYAAYLEQGLKQGFISTEFEQVFGRISGASANPVGKKMAGVNDSVTRASEFREDIFRLGHFIDAIRRSPVGTDVHDLFKQAAEEVRKYHFDYSDFTPFEKMALSRVIPFYKWTRKALPLMVEMIFAQPARMTIVPKAMANAQSAIMGGSGQGFATGGDEIIPEWVRQSGYYALGQLGGNTNYVRMQLPMTDAFNTLTNPAKTITSMMHPLAQLAVEGATGQQIGGGPIDSPAAYSASYAPQTNFLWKQLSSVQGGNGGDAGSIIAFLSGLGIANNTEQRMAGELARRKEVAADVSRRSKKEAQANAPTP